MVEPIKNDLNQLRDYSSLFSRRETISMLNNDFTSVDIKVHRYINTLPRKAIESYSSFLKYAYNLLKNNYPNEYVFKNSFLNQELINEVGTSNSVIINEFRTGSSVVDLAMFNGISKAFEIKTELDTVQRLKSQLESYKEAFNRVYIIVPESRLDSYQNYDKTVGLIAFDPESNKKFHTVRESEIRLDLKRSVLMENLNTHEYKDLIEQFYGELPEMNSFNQYAICFQLLKQIPTLELNNLYLSQMKNRSFEKVMSTRYYSELNQICLSLKLNKTKRKTLIDNLQAPIRL